MAPSAEGPSVTEVTSETEEKVFNKDQPRANPPPQQQPQVARNLNFTTFTLDNIPPS